MTTQTFLNQPKATTEEWDETFQMISWWKKDIVQKAEVMVVGAGALGNEVLKNLALLNIGNITIVDYDHIEYANLCRSVLFRERDCKTKNYKATVAARRIRSLNPNLNVRVVKGDIRSAVGQGLIRRMDVVIGCLDNRIARWHLNDICQKLNKTWIDAAIENLTAEVNVYTPGVSCYHCNLTSIELKNIEAQKSCSDVERLNRKKGRISTTPISASIAAAWQTQEALKIIHQDTANSLAGERLYLEGRSNFMQKTKTNGLKKGCNCQFKYSSILSAPFSSQDTFTALLDWLSETLKCENPVLKLSNEFVFKVCTLRSEKTLKLKCTRVELKRKLLSLLNDSQEEAVVITDAVSEVDHASPYKNRKLKALGIPPLQIVEVWANGEQFFVELSKDATFLK